MYYPVSGQQTYKRSLELMGNGFEITVVANDQNMADEYIDLAIEEMTRIERLISSWDPNSQTSYINNNAGIRAVRVDAELLELIDRAIKISILTDGAFDISYASMDRIWKYDGSMSSMPSEEEIRQSVAKVGYENIKLNKEESTVFLRNKGMKIGFGAIGKGYAADRAKAVLLEHGVSSGIINASGDMSAWGRQVNGQQWKVAITNPLDKEKAFAMLPINNGAVVTSGNYEKYVKFNGIRYSHIIDPRTGVPARGIISATVFAPKAEIADALATAIFVMGTEVGINRINQLPNIECVIIDEQGKLHTSSNIQISKI
ncbi:FAD:protein FMN transferase [Muriicola sp. Z0-33]|uniref:FAD:protein FMN transferase n=1 Tax=Muriicola sp. Z0-33 TaxID=2816957 RepID=UPI002237F3DE|nr:FAD:protein FMN transferase [Muriicola sp. Z0-33]MCW5515496.1 FAD:protein FMN transferase [Muriicola sp. Z0-33]